ncbi:hypothetical protein LINPERHAP2_LOCUS28754 [Linum perenne]
MCILFYLDRFFIWLDAHDDVIVYLLVCN